MATDYADELRKLDGIPEPDRAPVLPGETLPDYDRRRTVETAIDSHNSQVDAYRAQQEAKRQEVERELARKAAESAIRQNETISGTALKEAKSQVYDHTDAGTLNRPAQEREVARKENEDLSVNWEVDAKKAQEQQGFIFKEPTPEATAAAERLPTYRDKWLETDSKIRTMDQAAIDAERRKAIAQPLHARDKELADRLDAEEYQRNENALRDSGILPADTASSPNLQPGAASGAPQPSSQARPSSTAVQSPTAATSPVAPANSLSTPPAPAPAPSPSTPSAAPTSTQLATTNPSIEPTTGLPLDTAKWTPEQKNTWGGLELEAKQAFASTKQKQAEDTGNAQRLLGSMQATLVEQDGTTHDQARDRIAALDQDGLDRLMRQSAVREFGDNWFTNNSLIRGVAQGMLGIGKSALDFTRIFTDSPEKEATSQMLDRATEAIPQNVSSYKDIRNAGDVLDYGANAVGNLVPSMAIGLGAGAAVSVGLKAIPAVAEIAVSAQQASRLAAVAEASGNAARAAQLAAKAEKLSKLSALVHASGSLVGAFVPSYVQEAGGIYGDSEKEGHGSAMAALGFGAVAAALDAIEPARVIGRLTKKATVEEAKKAAATTLKGYLVGVGRAAIKDGLIEGGTEGLQTVVELAGQSASNDSWGKTFSDPKSWQNVTDSFLMGLIGGAGMGGLSSVSEQNADARAKLVAQAQVELSAKAVGARNMDTLFADHADAINSTEGIYGARTDLPPADAAAVKFAAAIDPNAPTDVLVTAQEEFQSAQSDLNRAKEATSRQNPLARDSAPVDAALARLEAATQKLDGVQHTVAGRLASDDAGVSSDFQRSLTMAREATRFSSEVPRQANGDPDNVSQRTIAQTIARIASGVPATAADLKLRSSEGGLIFHQDKATGRITMQNAVTQAALQKEAPTIAAAWNEFETSPANSNGPSMSSSGPASAPRPTPRAPLPSDDELSRKTLPELRQIAVQQGVDISTQQGEPPLSGGEVLQRIIRQRQTASPNEPIAGGAGTAHAVNGEGDERFAKRSEGTPVTNPPASNSRTRTVESPYAPRAHSALSDEMRTVIRPETEASRRAVDRAAEIVHGHLARWRPLFPRVKFELSGAGSAGLQFSPKHGALVVNVQDLLRDESNKDDGLLDHRFLEEFIHLSAIKAKINAEGLYRVLSPRLQRDVAAAYPLAKSDFQLGHEFLRMLVQSRVRLNGDGTMTWSDAGGNQVTETVTARAARAIRETAERLVRYFQKLADNLRADGAGKDQVEAIESAVAAVRDAMMPALAPKKDSQVVVNPRDTKPVESRETPIRESQTAAANPKNDNDNLQFQIPAPMSRQLLAFGRQIPDGELYTGEGGTDSFGGDGYGREDDPHVTLLYGPNVDAAKIQAAARGLGPVTLELGKVSIFSGKDTPYDVVKVEVRGPELHALHERLKGIFGTASTFPDYNPHITIAYVKKGEGAKYVGDARFDGRKVEMGGFFHSDRDGKKRAITLRGEKTTELANSSKPGSSGQLAQTGSPAPTGTITIDGEGSPVVDKAARTLRDAIRNKDRVIFHGMPGFLRFDPDGAVSFRRERTQEMYEVAPSLQSQKVEEIEGLSLDRIGQTKPEGTPPVEQLRLFSQAFGLPEEYAAVGEFLRGSPVAVLSGDEFARGEERSLVERVARWFAIEHQGHIRNPEIGEVILDRRGVKDSLAHGMGRAKAAAFAAVPEIIARGRVVDFQKNWKGRWHDRAIIAAPIRIGDSDRIAAIVVTRQQGSNRFYLHEAYEKKRLQGAFKTGASAPTEIGDEPSGARLGDIEKILARALSVNPPATGAGETLSSRSIQAAVGTPAFKAWFGDSKIIDAEGKPLVVYHGTSAAFSTFRLGMSARDSGDLGEGFYFSTDPEHAAAYAKNPSGGNIMPVYLRVINPLREFSEEFNRHVSERMKIPNPEPPNSFEESWTTIDASSPEMKEAARRSRAITAVAREMGHDGIWARNPRFGYTEIVVFDPEQIKSAKGNNGQFSPTDPDILSSQAFSRNLLTVHNLSQANLRHVLKLGGLAVPSMAIVRSDRSTFDNFGEITLVADKSLIDPRQNRSSKVFNADVYSPRYPTVKIELEPSAKKQFAQFLKGTEDFGDGYSDTIDGLLNGIKDDGFQRALENSGRFMAKYLQEQNLPFDVDPKEDGYRQKTKLREIVRAGDDGGAKFEEWVRELPEREGWQTKERIFDGFTYSGNRKYLKHDLDTVVKILKRKLQDGEGFNYGVPSVRAVVAKKFRTVEQIQKAREDIIPKEQMDALKEEVNDEFMALSEQLAPDRHLDGFSDDLKAMAEGGPENWRHLREMYPDGVPSAQMQSFLEKLRNMPTEYFEGKIQRSVSLMEFKAAVVPDNLPDDLRRELTRRGLEVVDYPKSNLTARREAVQRAAESTGVLFSQPFAESENAETDFVEKTSEASPAIARRMLNLVKRQLVPYGAAPAEAAALLREAKLQRLYSRKIATDWARLLNKGTESELLGFHVPDGMMTGENKRLMFDVLIGGRKIDTLPAELRPIAERVRSIIDNLGERAVDAGLLNPETFERNKGTYLPRLYHSKELAERGLVGAGRKLHRMLLERTGNPRLSDAYAITRGGKPVNHSPGKFRFPDALTRDAHYDQLQRKEVLTALRAQGGVGPLTDEDIADPSRLAPGIQDRILRLKERFAEKFEKNDPWSDESLDRMGLIREPAYPVGKAILQLSHDITMANLFNQIALNRDWVSESDIHGFTQMPDNPRWGKLAGKYVQEDVAQELNALADVPSTAWQIYDAALQTWKKWKTAYNPATHGRNMIGNILFADWAGVNPLEPWNAKHYARAIGLLRGRSVAGITVEELYREGVLGNDFNAQELQDALEGISAEISPETVAQKIWQLLGKPGQWAQKAYEVEDSIFKTAAYVKARGKGMTPKEAADHVRKWFPSYDNLPTSSTMTGLRRVVPFGGFFYEAMRIGATAARERPIRFAAAMAVPSLITLYSLMAMGIGDDDKDDILEEMRGKLFGWPVFSALMPWTDANGLPVQWDLTNVIPYANPLGLRLDRNEKDPPIWQDIVRTLLTSNPVMNIAVGLATNQDPFTGRELRVASQTPLEEIGEAAKFVGKTVAPPLTPGVGTTWGTITAPERSRGTLEKRDQVQSNLRALMGVDLRTSAPSLYRAIEKFQQERGYSERPERMGETAVSRSKSRLYEALINEDLVKIARELRYLDSQNIPLKTGADVQKWLSYRNPLTGSGRIKKDDVPAFMRFVGPMQAKQVARTMVEYNRIVAQSPRMFAEARAGIRR